MTDATQRPPVGLKARGRAFWRAVVEASDEAPWPDEREMLVELARTLDLVEDLAATLRKDGMTSRGSMGQVTAHPLLPELRQARILAARLTAQLGFEHDDGSAGIVTPLSARGRNAANKRWAGHTKVAELDDVRRHRRAGA